MHSHRAYNDSHECQMPSNPTWIAESVAKALESNKAVPVSATDALLHALEGHLSHRVLSRGELSLIAGDLLNASEEQDTESPK